MNKTRVYLQKRGRDLKKSCRVLVFLFARPEV